MLNKDCLQCNKKFQVENYRMETAKFCSKSCLAKSKVGKKGANWQGGKIDKKCIDCIKIVSNKRNTRCRSCSDEYRSGKNNPAWRGGITPFIKSIRTMVLYKQWRTSVYERDDFTCLHCNQKGGILNADHIVSFREIIRKFNVKSIQEAKNCKELWNINNGRTLCFDCHKKTDTFGYKSFKNNQTVLCR